MNDLLPAVYFWGFSVTVASLFGLAMFLIYSSTLLHCTRRWLVRFPIYLGHCYLGLANRITDCVIRAQYRSLRNCSISFWTRRKFLSSFSTPSFNRFLQRVMFPRRFLRLSFAVISLALSFVDASLVPSSTVLAKISTNRLSAASFACLIGA